MHEFPKARERWWRWYIWRAQGWQCHGCWRFSRLTQDVNAKDQKRKPGWPVASLPCGLWSFKIEDCALTSCRGMPGLHNSMSPYLISPSIRISVNIQVVYRCIIPSYPINIPFTTSSTVDRRRTSACRNGSWFRVQLCSNFVPLCRSKTSPSF